MTTKEYIAEYRARRRAEAILFLGGICAVCGVRDDLEFDHIEPKSKLFTISGYTGSKASFWAEVEKCQLLCKKHHKEKTLSEYKNNRRHGTYTMYRHGCRCEPCKENHRVMKRRWKENYKKKNNNQAS